MLSSIHPLGERSRKNQWPVTAASHVVGAGLGGAASGLVAGSLGWLVFGWSLSANTLFGNSEALRTGLLGFAALIAVLIELGKLPIRLPSWHRQVNEAWIDEYRGWVYGAGFGFQLGLGFATIITTAAVHVLLVAALLTGSPLGGALVGVVFGLARGALLLTGRSITSPQALRTFHQRLAAGAGTADIVARSALALTAGVALSGAALLGGGAL